MNSLRKSPRYTKFSQERNRALEAILNKKLVIVDSLIDRLKEDVLDVTASALLNKTRCANEFVTRVNSLVLKTASDAVSVAMSIRRATYTLAYAGELEATARGLNKPLKASLTKEDVKKKLSLESPSGGNLADRIRFYFDRLGRRLTDAFELGRVLEEKPDEIVERVASAFPSTRPLIRPKPVLQKPVREAKPPTKRLEDFLVAGFIDDELWDEAVQSYVQDVVQIGRGPEDTVKVNVGKEKVERYTWEVEKEIVEDFVQLVREGQVDGARENGIKDFVWIAVIDDRTDECCRWRDGLSTSEIARQLKGKHKNDDCDAVVPPAHFNCRCDLAPLTEEVPDEGREELGDFETWLTQK